MAVGAGVAADQHLLRCDGAGHQKRWRMALVAGVLTFQYQRVRRFEMPEAGAALLN